MLTLQDLKDYIGIDYTDEMNDRVMNGCISTADAYLKGMIGNDYPADDPRAVALAKIIAADLYETRTLTVKETGSVRQMVSDFKLQLQLERRLKNDIQ